MMDGSEHDGLITHSKLIAHNDASELFQRYVEDLITKSNLFKVINDTLVCPALQFWTEADVSKLPNANAVLSAEVPLEKVPACQDHIVHNKLVSRKKQVLHDAFRHGRDARVCIVNDELHDVRRQAGYLEVVLL